MAKWNTSETGILRKKVVPENHEDLLVFGYACKLFRDDDKAKYIDQGKHLIPWMADETLRIDRYDCRGALSDLSAYEASREGYDATRWLGLSESDRRIEQLCDEERYYSLRTNEEEEAMYKEEELKRLQQKTNEFAYSYDVPQNPATVEPVNPPGCEEEDKEYVPKPELGLPSDIVIPKTEKENARIEKTASFVCQQGPQMEILIKTKQANNPQFSFLNQSDPLYKYYKHILNALKMGSYKIESSTQEEEKKEIVEQDTNDDHYLHPSLVQTSVQATSTIPTIPTVTYKPTADCAYSQLVNRIQGSQVDGVGVASIQTNKSEGDGSPQQAQNQLSYEQQQQQYYQYYYMMQYYEYHKQLVQQCHSMGGTDGQTISPLIQEQINAQAAAYAQMAYTQYVQQNTNNPYSQLVSNLAQATKDNIYTPVAQSVPEINQSGDITKAPIIYSQSEAERPPVYPQSSNSPLPNQPPKQEPSKTVTSQPDKPSNASTKPAFPLVHYGSDSEDETGTETDAKDADSSDDRCKIPPDETKLIIDKMASYVAKNGRDFEAIVKSKGDPRFEFLNEDHEYHPYYKIRIREGGEGEAATAKESPKSVRNGVQSPPQKDAQPPQPAKPKDKKVITPVSFSIKKPKEEIPKDIKSALPIEESDEEIPEETPSNSKEPISIRSPDNQHLNPPIAPTTTSLIKELPKEPETNSGNSPLLVKEKSTTPEKKTIDNPLDGDDPILEMIDLTEDLEEKKDARRAEDRIKDKLAAAAREKLASVHKDRALQMERKKKAAAFLKLKSAETDKGGAKVTSKKEDKIEEDKVLIISDSDNNKVESEKEKNHRRSRSRTRDSHAKRDDSDSEEGEIKKRRKSKRKKSHHKRKRSRSQRRSSSHYKKVKKRRKRSDSYHETSSSDD
ncbi:su(w[a]) [Trypoxylus dichotomus]